MLIRLEEREEHRLCISASPLSRIQLFILISLFNTRGDREIFTKVLCMKTAEDGLKES
jgi:hypothetical protein